MMKWFIIAILIGAALPVFGLWRLAAKRMGDGGCLLPFILSVLVLSIVALALA